MNEEAIISALIKGEEGAIDTIYQLYSSQVYNTALGYLKNIEEAEEVTQDVFVKIYTSAHSFKRSAKLSTWIYRITINQSLDRIRKRKAQKRFVQLVSIGKREDQPEVDIPDFHHPGISLEQKENAALLFKVIDTLAENQRTAFILSYVEHLPRQEVADIMQVSLKSVESLLQRAKQNLRKKLKDLYPDRRK